MAEHHELTIPNLRIVKADDNGMTNFRLSIVVRIPVQESCNAQRTGTNSKKLMMKS
jgi:hypothetical protein